VKSEDHSPFFSIGFVGDICIAMGVTDVIKKHGPQFPFEKIIPVFADMDLVVGNLECCLVNDNCPKNVANKVMAVNTQLAEGLKLDGFQLLNLANNHIMDCGDWGLKTTVEYLNNKNIMHFGAGVNIREAERPIFVEVGGKRVAFLGNCDVSRLFATEKSAGVAPLNLARLPRQLRKIQQESDFIVAIVHADLEFSHYPQPYRI